MSDHSGPLANTVHTDTADVDHHLPNIIVQQKASP